MLKTIIKGRVWKFGDDIDTDQIYPGKYLPITDKKEMAEHALEGMPGASDFMEKVQTGDILVVGKNFGCGSSREHAAVAIIGKGVSLVIAESFARIFYRNSINTGLPVLECKEAKEINQGDELEVNVETGEIKNLTADKIYKASPISDLELDIMKAGGLLNYLKKETGE
jgi:3-isopropylmalate/(R)-2-methylmalate dehydratase small subunit